MSDIENIEYLIENNKLFEVLDIIKSYFKDVNNEELLNDTILTISRLNNQVNNFKNGIIDMEEKEKNRITLQILNLKSIIKSHTANPAISKNTKLIFKDDFYNNNNNWDIQDNQYCSSEIKYGRYFIEHKRNEKSILWNKEILLNQEKDFRISSLINFISGSKTGHYGLYWGYGEAELKSEYYLHCFVISSEGRFGIFTFIENQISPLIGWQKNTSINTGTAFNKLEIIKRNERINFLINSEVVFIGDYSSFYGNEIGFIIFNNSRIAVENLLIEN